jgi:DNA-binding HxlR family transcriptional regulator
VSVEPTSADNPLATTCTRTASGGELRRAVGRVSDKVLIQQLKELPVDGIIDRFDYGEIPPKIEYSLTAFGRTLGKALAALSSLPFGHQERLHPVHRFPGFLTVNPGLISRCGCLS